MTAPTTDEARRTVAAANELVRRVAALLAAGDGLQYLARQQLDRLKVDEVDRRLRVMPLAILKDATGRGARLGALEQAGFRTVADVLHASAYGLQVVPGVGDTTARQVMHAARAAATAVHHDVRFRFDPDRRDPEQTELLATLAALRAADGMPPALRQDLVRLVERIEPLAVTAARAGRRVSMFFARPSTRTTVHAALAQLSETPSTRAMRLEVDRLERATDPRTYDPVWLWQSYGRDAAAVNATLATVGAGPATEDGAAEGFVPDEIRQRIVAVPLDTSRLRPTTTLRGYQVFGAQYALHQQRAMLGDEMGLGKTLQALASIGHLAARGQRRFLVVCPASVQIN